MKSKDLHVGKAWRAWWPAVTVALGIFVASSIPGRHLPPSRIPHLDKLQHGTAYLLLGATCAHGVELSGLVVNGPVRMMLAGAAMAFAYGASDELHQAFVPGRSPDLADLGADGLGALLGGGLRAIIGAMLRARMRRRLPAKRPS
jgi:VanZ family protein